MHRAIATVARAQRWADSLAMRRWPDNIARPVHRILGTRTRTRDRYDRLSTACPERRVAKNCGHQRCRLVLEPSTPLAGNSVCIVGVWDPLLPGHLAAMRRLKNYAETHRREALVVCLDPRPIVFREDPGSWPVFNEVSVRARILEEEGLAVAICHMRKEDADLGAKEILDCLVAVAGVRELWLRQRQSFGPGVAGSQESIIRSAQKAGVSVNIIEDLAFRPTAMFVRRYLAQGKIFDAAALAERYPTHRCVSIFAALLGYAPGSYKAEIWNGNACQPGRVVEASCSVTRSGAAICEPSGEFEWLRLVTGPNDFEVTRRLGD